MGSDGDEEGPYAGRLAAFRGELAALVDRLDELALDILRDAVEAGRSKRPGLERRVTRARNGLERALRLLEPGPGAGEGEQGG